MLRDAQTRAVRQHQPAFAMAAGGDTVTCAELELRSNRLAHFLRASGLRRLDHYAIFIENNTPYVECCSAGEFSSPGKTLSRAPEARAVSDRVDSTR